MNIENNLPCFVMLWQQLEHTRQLLVGQHRRFCVRSIIRSWVRLGIIDLESTHPQLSNSQILSDLVWEVCLRASRPGNEVFGLNELPPPSTHPRIHREILRSLVMVSLGLGKHNVRLHDLDEAYHIAFPNSTPLNVAKKRRCAKIHNRTESLTTFVGF